MTTLSNHQVLEALQLVHGYDFRVLPSDEDVLHADYGTVYHPVAWRVPSIPSIPQCYVNTVAWHTVSAVVNVLKDNSKDIRSLFLCCSNGELSVLRSLRKILDDSITIHLGYKIDGMEIDFYIPALELAIEFNGTRFHRVTEKKSAYHHQNRYLALKKRGISMITVWSDSWFKHYGTESLRIHAVLRSLAYSRGLEDLVRDYSVVEGESTVGSSMWHKFMTEAFDNVHPSESAKNYSFLRPDPELVAHCSILYGQEYGFTQHDDLTEMDKVTTVISAGVYNGKKKRNRLTSHGFSLFNVNHGVASMESLVIKQFHPGVIESMIDVVLESCPNVSVVIAPRVPRDSGYGIILEQAGFKSWKSDIPEIMELKKKTRQFTSLSIDDIDLVSGSWCADSGSDYYALILD